MNTIPTPTTNWSHADLQRLNDEKALTLIPAMVVFGLYIVVGVTGNSLVCYVMGLKLKMNTQNLLIVYLAVFDLLSCVISMPMDIYDMQNLFMFPSETVCKIFRTITAFTTISSILTLSIIAVDRYLKICRSMTYTMDIRKVKLSLIVVVLGSAAFSCPSYFIFGIRTIDSGIPGYPGHDCSTSDAVKGTYFPLAYLSFLFLLFILFCVFLAILYSRILSKTRNYRRLMTSMLIPMRTSISSIVQENLSSSSDNLKRTSSIGYLNSSRPSGLQEEEAVTDFSNSSGNDVNENSPEIGEVDNDIIGAVDNDKRIQQSSGLEYDQRVNNDYGMKSVDNQDCQTHGNSNNNDYDMKSVDNQDCQKPENSNNNEYGMKRVDNQDCQKHENSNNNEYDMKSVVNQDCQKHDNSNNNDYDMKSVDNQDCQKPENSNNNDYDMKSVDNQDCRWKEDDTKIDSCDFIPNAQCDNSDQNNTNAIVSVNSRTLIKRNEEPGDSLNMRSSSSIVSSESCRTIQTSTKTLVENTKHTPSPKHFKKFDPNRKMSTSSLVLMYSDVGKGSRKSSSVSSKLDHKTTIIAFIVTLVFILSCLPYLCLQIVKVNIKGFDYNLHGAALVFFNISLRSYYINSITNPFIYGVYNTNFRRELRGLWSRFRRKCSRINLRTEEEDN